MAIKGARELCMGMNFLMQTNNFFHCEKCIVLLISRQRDKSAYQGCFQVLEGHFNYVLLFLKRAIKFPVTLSYVTNPQRKRIYEFSILIKITFDKNYKRSL